jgi:hypothetical protein
MPNRIKKGNKSVKKRKRSKGKNSIKVSGKTPTNSTTTVYNGFGNLNNSLPTKYGFGNSTPLRTSAQINRRIKYKHKNPTPIFRFADDLKFKISEAIENEELIVLMIKFIETYENKLTPKVIESQKLQDLKAKIIMNVNDFLKLLEKNSAYAKKDLNKVLKVVNELVKKHKINKTLDTIRVTQASTVSVTNSVSNNSNTW